MNNQKHDVVIIGAGIGGLICGAYLAKAGLNVVIVEKRNQVGGCCASFRINGFNFDAFVHSFGSCRKGGYVDRILNDLDLKEALKFERYNPSDIVIIGNERIEIGGDANRIILQLQKIFPKERKKIKDFFEMVNRSELSGLYLKFRKKSFSDLLNAYFESFKLKAIISISVLGNASLPPSTMNAFSAIIVLKEFILDGGYYPIGGMQNFSNLLAESAKKAGVEIILNNPVRQILFKNNCSYGVILKDNSVLKSSNVIANCSVPDVYLDLLNRQNNVDFRKLTISRFKPSLSAVTVFLGVEGELKVDQNLNCNLWLLPNYNLEKMYEKINSGGMDSDDVYLLIYMSEYFRKRKNKTICAFVNAPFNTISFWKKNREKVLTRIISKIEQIIPNIRKCIKVKSCITPHAVLNYTNNYMGATYGWMPSVEQSWNTKAINELSFIKNLSFVGHWTTQGFGVPSVMELGRKTAIKIIQN